MAAFCIFLAHNTGSYKKIASRFGTMTSRILNKQSDCNTQSALQIWESTSTHAAFFDRKQCIRVKQTGQFFSAQTNDSHPSRWDWPGPRAPGEQMQALVWLVSPSIS